MQVRQEKRHCELGTMAPNFIAPVSQYLFFSGEPGHFGEFLTDLYSLFDQKIHCTLEQQNLVFSGKIDRINFADFC